MWSGHESDRAHDHRAGAAPGNASRWSATSGSSHGTCGGPERDCQTWSYSGIRPPRRPAPRCARPGAGRGRPAAVLVRNGMECAVKTSRAPARAVPRAASPAASATASANIADSSGWSKYDRSFDQFRRPVAGSGARAGDVLLVLRTAGIPPQAEVENTAAGGSRWIPHWPQRHPRRRAPSSGCRSTPAAVRRSGADLFDQATVDAVDRGHPPKC